jgi:hypothetical protein
MSLERAKSAPLDINLDTSSKGRWLSDLLIPYIQNTKTLTVYGLPAIELKDTLPKFPQSMSNLRSLTLVAHGDSGWDRFIDPFESFSPTLRCLKLICIPLYPSLLKLGTLTELDIRDPQFNLHLDTLLDFLEENRSLESATLEIKFTEPSLRSSRRRTPIKNRLRYLRIACFDAMEGQGLISNIALSEGAKLEFYGGIGARVNDVLSGISTTHLSNLSSPTFMEYRANVRNIRLLGPNGSATFRGPSTSDIPFVEFPRLPLTNIRRLHLDTHGWKSIRPHPGPAVFHHLPFFPALEVLAVERNTDLSHLLSALISNPLSSPSLKTLAFLGCTITEGFMEELTRFASARKNTPSAGLHRVVILRREGEFPSTTSVRQLEDSVLVVDVRDTKEMPADLTLWFDEQPDLF